MSADDRISVERGAEATLVKAETGDVALLACVPDDADPDELEAAVDDLAAELEYHRRSVATDGGQA